MMTSLENQINLFELFILGKFQHKNYNGFVKNLQFSVLYKWTQK